METAATRAEEVSSQAEASREAALTEAASVEVSEAALTVAASEEVVAGSVAATDSTSRTTMSLRSPTTTPNKSKLVLLCLQLKAATVGTRVASSSHQAAKITRNTAAAAIIILRLIIMEADTIMAVVNKLIIHLVVITNTNNELNKTTRQHT